MSPGQYPTTAVSVNQDNTFFSLFCCTAEQLKMDWPSPSPPQKLSGLAGLYLPLELTMFKNRLPIYPDFVTELTSTWNKPLSTWVHRLRPEFKSTVPSWQLSVVLEALCGSTLLSLWIWNFFLTRLHCFCVDLCNAGWRPSFSFCTSLMHPVYFWWLQCYITPKWGVFAQGFPTG